MGLLGDGLSQGVGRYRGYSLPAKYPFIVIEYGKMKDIDAAIGTPLYHPSYGDSYSETYAREQDHAESLNSGLPWYWSGDCFIQSEPELGRLAKWEGFNSFDAMVREMHSRGWEHYVQMYNGGSFEIKTVDWAAMGLERPEIREWETPPEVVWQEFIDTTPEKYKSLSDREILDNYGEDGRYFNFANPPFSCFDCRDEEGTRWRRVIYGKEATIKALQGWRENNSMRNHYELGGEYKPLYTETECFLCGDEYEVIYQKDAARPDYHGKDMHMSGVAGARRHFEDYQSCYYMRPHRFLRPEQIIKKWDISQEIYEQFKNIFLKFETGEMKLADVREKTGLMSLTPKYDLEKGSSKLILPQGKELAKKQAEKYSISEEKAIIFREWLVEVENGRMDSDYCRSATGIVVS